LCANGSDMANGRQSLWIIYKYFASPNTGDVDQGLSVTYSVLDLALIEAQGGDEGLEKYWTKWTKTISNVADGGGRRSVFEHLFVDEMREAPLMDAYVLAYDEADPGAEKHTWWCLLKKGQASFQRERERRNLRQQQKALRGVTHAGGRKGVSFEDVAPAYEITTKGGGQESRQNDQPNTQQSTTPKQQPALNDAPERTLRGKCWFFARGSCAEENCRRDHIMMTDEETARALDSFWATGRKGTSNGRSSDSEGNAREKGGGADNRSKGEGEGEGPKIMGCRYINVGKECLHGEKCNYKWARSLPPQGPPVEFDRRPVRERRINTLGPIITEETSDNDSGGSVASSSGSEGSGQALRGAKPKLSE
jgi:hypothetical protein